MTATLSENPLGDATGDSGSLGISVTLLAVESTSNGSVDAHIGDATTVIADTVSLGATGTSTPTGTGQAVGIGLASLAGSSVNATDTSLPRSPTSARRKAPSARASRPTSPRTAWTSRRR